MSQTRNLYPVPDHSDISTEVTDIASEEMSLACMLMATSAVTESIPILAGSDFYIPAHQDIYETICSHYSDGKPLELVALHASLPSQTKAALSLSELFALSQKAVSPASATYYATRVKKAAQLRRIALQLRTSLAATLRNPEPFDIASAAVSDLTRLLCDKTEESTTAGSATTEALERAAARAEGRDLELVLNTGYTELDGLLGGVRNGQFILCAGRPGAGKSIAALDIARYMAIRNNHPVLFFSLEMSELEIGQRIISAESSVPLAKIISGTMTDEEWGKCMTASKRIEQAPLYIDVSSNVTTQDIRAKAHQMTLTNDISCVIIDYLGLLRHPNEHRMESRQAIMSDISRDLKLIARDVVPIIALAQLNRAVESRNDKKPILSDLRDTGALEQDSDVVIMLHREDVHNSESNRSGEVDLIVAKHRNGPTGTITLANQYHMARLANLF